MKYSLNIRMWHWLNAIVILGLLGTVFLKSTFLNWKINAEILTTKLSEIKISILPDQAKVLAKAVGERMWDWHIYLGFALGILVLYRLYIYFKDDSKRDKFSDLNLHKKGVKSLYYIFYAVLVVMSISGFVIYFHKELGLSRDFAHDIKEIHEAFYYFILFFVPLHIAGVAITDATQENGLISTMFHGKER